MSVRITRTPVTQNPSFLDTQERQPGVFLCRPVGSTTHVCVELYLHTRARAVVAGTVLTTSIRAEIQAARRSACHVRALGRGRRTMRNLVLARRGTLSSASSVRGGPGVRAALFGTGRRAPQSGAGPEKVSAKYA